MSFIGKLLIGIGIFVGVMVLIAVGITGFVFKELRQHGVSIHESYHDDHEYSFAVTSTETIDATGKESIFIKNSAGNVEVIGWDKSAVEMEVTKRSDDESKLDEIQYQIDSSGPEIQVSWDSSSKVNDLSWRIDLVIKVPASLGVKLDLGVGNSRLSGIQTTQPVRIDSGVGKLEVVDVMASDVSVDMGVGDLFVKNIQAPTINVSLGLGELDVRLVESSSVMIDAEVGVGNLKISGLNIPGTKVVKHDFLARSAHIRLGDAATQIKLEVGMGDLKLLFEK